MRSFEEFQIKIELRQWSRSTNNWNKTWKWIWVLTFGSLTKNLISNVFVSRIIELIQVHQPWGLLLWSFNDFLIALLRVLHLSWQFPCLFSSGSLKALVKWKLSGLCNHFFTLRANHVSHNCRKVFSMASFPHNRQSQTTNRHPRVWRLKFVYFSFLCMRLKPKPSKH